MTRESMKSFLNDMIEVYSGYKSRILNPEAFVDNWMEAFGDRTEEEVREAGQIWIDKNRFFPSTDEFTRPLLIAESRRTVREQEEYERTHPSPPEDQAIVDAVIREIFEEDEE